MNRREFHRSVRAQIIHRAMNAAGQIACEGCGLVLGKKPYHIDHTKPDALEIDKWRALTADDGKLLGWACCHKPKTAEDVAIIAKAKRVERKHFGDRGSKRPSFATNRGGPWKAKIGGGVERRT